MEVRGTTELIQFCCFAVQLAKYIDRQLTKGVKVMEAETDDKLNSAIMVFRYLDDKDQFYKVRELSFVTCDLIISFATLF